jgi:hypothetical protein
VLGKFILEIEGTLLGLNGTVILSLGFTSCNHFLIVDCLLKFYFLVLSINALLSIGNSLLMESIIREKIRVDLLN